MEDHATWIDFHGTTSTATTFTARCKCGWLQQHDTHHVANRAMVAHMRSITQFPKLDRICERCKKIIQLHPTTYTYCRACQEFIFAQYYLVRWLHSEKQRQQIRKRIVHG